MPACWHGADELAQPRRAGGARPARGRLGELDAVDARILTAEFEADYYGTSEEAARFAVVRVTLGILDDAATLCARHPLRGVDAIQLASALAVREVDAKVATMAVFDLTLRAAAAAEGLAVVPH